MLKAWRILSFASLIIIMSLIFHYTLWVATTPESLTQEKRRFLNRTLGFDHIYVINLKYRLDRRQRMDAMAKVLGLDFDFFPAVSRFDQKTLDKYNFSLSSDQKACYASHYEVYRSMINNRYDNALILEDDVDIELNVTSIMYEIQEILPSNWDLLYVGHCWDEKDSPYDNRTSSAFRLYHSTLPVCTHAYGVSSRGLKKLARLIVHPSEPIDVDLIDWIHAGNLTSYSVNPSAIVQWKSKDNPSDVPNSGMAYTFYLKNSTLEFLGYKRV